MSVPKQLAPAMRSRVGVHIPIFLFIALVSLAAGVSLPILHVHKLLVFSQFYSILDGILRLAHENELLLAGIVLAFSIVFPIAKLFMLLLLWIALRKDHNPSERWLVLLNTLAKWSMMDVFVVSLIIFAVKASAFADARVGFAVYPFLGTVGLTAYCSWKVKRCCDSTRSERANDPTIGSDGELRADPRLRL